MSNTDNISSAGSTDKTIRDIMTPDPVGVYFDQTIAETARVMRDAQVGAVLVVSGESLTGVVTDRDLVVRGLAAGVSPDDPVGPLCSPKLVGVAADADVAQRRAADHRPRRPQAPGRRRRRADRRHGLYGRPRGLGRRRLPAGSRQPSPAQRLTIPRRKAGLAGSAFSFLGAGHKSKAQGQGQGLKGKTGRGGLRASRLAWTFRAGSTGRGTACPAKCKKTSRGCRTPC